MIHPRIIAVIGPYGNRLLLGVSQFAKTVGGWQLILAPDFNDSAESPDSLKHQGVIGQFFDDHIPNWLRKHSIPAVNLGSSCEHSSLPTVMEDNLAIGQMGAQHFIDRGFEHLAFFYDPFEAYWSQARGQGFLSQAEQAGLRVHRLKPTPDMDNTQQQGYFIREIKALPRPLGLMACNDSYALNLAYFLMNADIAVPEDVALLGVDNDEVTCEMSPVPISSVQPDFIQAGYRGAELLWNQMQGQAVPPETHEFIAPKDIVVRRSTDIMAISDRDVARALQYFHEHLGDNITIEDASEAVAMSRRSLEKRFQATLGRSPGEELSRLRLEKARNLLLHTDMTMGNIATACGFGDPAYFSRAFSKAEGIPPTKFRESHRLT